MASMPTGLYREVDGWVRVDYGKFRISIPRRKYEAIRYKPTYDQLPMKDDHEKSSCLKAPEASAATP
jgi:hypothetical protein